MASHDQTSLDPGPAPTFGFGVNKPAPAANVALNGHLLALFICLLTILVIRAGAMPQGFHWLARLAGFFEPFAWPAYFAFAGVACHDFLNTKWSIASRDYLEPAIIYGALWVTLAAATGYAAGIPMLAPLAASLRATVGLWEIPALLALPAIMLIAQRLIGERPLILLIVAATLHLMELKTGSVFVNAGFSGFIYFVIGTLGARSIKALASWSLRHPIPAITIVCVWAIYSALAIFHPATLIADLGIAQVPIAKFGLALTGIGALAMISGLMGLVQVIQRTLAGEPRIAHLWRPVALLIPLALGTLSGLLVALRLAPSHAGALAVIAVMGVTAVVTVAIVRLFGLNRTSLPQTTAATAEMQPARQLPGSSVP